MKASLDPRGLSALAAIAPVSSWAGRTADAAERGCNKASWAQIERFR